MISIGKESKKEKIKEKVIEIALVSLFKINVA